MKKKLIASIKELIAEIGSTTTGMMQSECSQIYKSVSKDHHFLVEGYNLDNISVVEYIHEQVASEFYAPYEDLTTAQLKIALEELKEYASTIEENK